MYSRKKQLVAYLSGAMSIGILVFIFSDLKNFINTKVKEADKIDLADSALLSLVKNDRASFIKFLQEGGNIHLKLPPIEGKTLTVAEGIAFFERTEFMEVLRERKISFINQDTKKDFDILTLSIKKNRPAILNELARNTINFNFRYGKKGHTVLHLASIWCSDKLAPILHKKGRLRWDTQAADGSTPLTLAAENECLPLLTYWKNQGADFGKQDGRGKSVHSILKRTTKLELMALTEETAPIRKVGNVIAAAPNFYKKRKIPKIKLLDHSLVLEPEDRPLDSVETARFSEFAD